MFLAIRILILFIFGLGYLSSGHSKGVVKILVIIVLVFLLMVKITFNYCNKNDTFSTFTIYMCIIFL